jgi:hypothetical protein
LLLLRLRWHCFHRHQAVIVSRQYQRCCICIFPGICLPFLLRPDQSLLLLLRRRLPLLLLLLLEVLQGDYVISGVAAPNCTSLLCAPLLVHEKDW